MCVVRVCRFPSHSLSDVVYRRLNSLHAFCHTINIQGSAHMIFMKKEREGWMEIKRADVVVFSHLLLLILCIVSFSYTFSFSFSLLSFSVSGKKKFCFVHGLSSWMTPSLDIASRSFMSSFLKDFLFSMSFSCNERGRERGRERHRFTFVKKDSYQEESSCLVFLDILWKKRLCAAFKCVSPFIAWIPLRRMWTDDKMTDSAGERFERR